MRQAVWHSPPPPLPLASRARHAPGGNDDLSLSAFSESLTASVYRYLVQRTLNLVTLLVFMILTWRASFRRAMCKKSRISLISLGLRAGWGVGGSGHDVRSVHREQGGGRGIPAVSVCECARWCSAASPA